MYTAAAWGWFAAERGRVQQISMHSWCLAPALSSKPAPRRCCVHQFVFKRQTSDNSPFSIFTAD